MKESTKKAHISNCEQNVRVVTVCMNYPYLEVAQAILGQLRGKAAALVRDLLRNFAKFTLVAACFSDSK